VVEGPCRLRETEGTSPRLRGTWISFRFSACLWVWISSCFQAVPSSTTAC